MNTGAGDEATRLRAAIEARRATVAVIGLGYVGLPLAMAVARAGFPVIGFDIAPDKVAGLAAGRSYIGAVADETLAAQLDAGRFRPTADYADLAAADIFVVCVPTPLTRHRTPDLRFVEATAESLATVLRPGALVVLESTSYPGTTREVMLPRLEASGLKSGHDLFVGYSPEREEPGNTAFTTTTIPKIVAGDGGAAAQLTAAFYGKVVETVVPVPSIEVAEAAKITENVFRAVNIALVNELKVIYDAMGIDVWEVIEAASTKPFGFMPFYPGPGLGGHCIPIDPFYLAWKSREYDLPTRFIELAGEINRTMPHYVVARLERALDERLGLPLGRARVLVAGLAYKKNVADVRESPALKLIELLDGRAAAVSYADPLVATIPPTREYRALAGRQAAAIDRETIRRHDAVLVATDHDAFDYALIAEAARLIVDTRNVFARNGLFPATLVKA